MTDTSASLTYAVDRIGDRWAILIVDALMGGPLKFGEIEATVEGIVPTMLTKRLRSLESSGIVLARPYNERPIRFTYELTGTGTALAGAIALLRDWGATHTGDDHGPLHEACGTAVVTRLWCPSCEVTVDVDDANENISL